MKRARAAVPPDDMFRYESERHRIVESIQNFKSSPRGERIALYNAAVKALRTLVSDACDDPALSPQIVPIGDVEANDYNPNRVAMPEMDLLEQSIRFDGITMPVVAQRDDARGKWLVVDGFHRRTVVADRLGRKWLPVTEIDRPIGDRMASTIRHNCARGRHQVDLMASIVRSLMEHEWNDERIASHLGMCIEELLRLKETWWDRL